MVIMGTFSLSSIFFFFLSIYLSFLLVETITLNRQGVDILHNADHANFYKKKTRNPNLSARVLPSQFQKSKSLSLLMNQVLQVNRQTPDAFQNSGPELCQKFKIMSYNNRTKQRRIFAGGLIADDSWHVIGANALETYGIFHSVTFVESNRTQNYTPRKVRFESNPPTEDYTILQSGIYGPNTPVYVEQFAYEKEELPMMREHMMRQRILSTWKTLGMTREDIGIIFDTDEIPSRDFLRAAQICEISKNSWRTDEKQTCRTPLVRMSFPMFEGSPNCIHSGKQMFKRFLSTAMVIGACIEGIGDGGRHPIVPRAGKDMYGNNQGAREKGYGEQFNYDNIKNGNEHGLFPLYNSADFRRMLSEVSMFGGVGYHLHNFFDDAERIRFKYAYYGHVHKHAYTAPLGALNADLNLLVKCAHNISDEGNRKRRLKNGLQLLEEMYSLPAAFQIEGYVDARHRELITILEQDEKEYGRADKFDGNHLYQEHMLTHTGRIQKEGR